ncbi:sensor histidine kinase [Paenimyroides aestuarii]|uniref:histidine kinase n=1 Tax=Paenimyroides aestuarii TaxID=2968490 RepID=A0ABY5NUQ5_9FLAO|nr:ATP-binding protein [Paenimyroides aestuarii]UUV22330.1 histidine kinase [Paenimyroides aestuarii]
MQNTAEVELFLWIGTSVMAFLAIGVILLAVLHQAKVERLKRKESENLLKASLLSEKKERQRIASDLHDGISGDLSALQNYINLLRKQEKDLSKIDLFDDILVLIKQSTMNLKNISYSLMPPTIESHGIVTTLQNHFERMGKLHNITFTEAYTIDSRNIPSAVSYELYRIIQELTNNAVKHGKANNIDVQMFLKNEEVYVVMNDNGSPFDFYSHVKHSKGMGLKNILLRVQQINAELECTPKQMGNTTQIKFKTNNYVEDSYN